MNVLTVFTLPEMSVEERLRLKDRAADSYREQSGTTDGVGVDRFDLLAPQRAGGSISVRFYSKELPSPGWRQVIGPYREVSGRLEP